MLFQPVSHLGWCVAQISQVRFHVDGALVPEGQAVIIDHVERVGWEEPRRVRGGRSAYVIAVCRELDDLRGVITQRLL
jgi:hypothetical protein